MKNTALVFWVALVLAAIGSYGGWVIYRHSQAQAASPSGSRETDSRNRKAIVCGWRLPATVPACRRSS